MPDLLLEVLSEEIPARMQAGGAQELEKQVCSRLEAARLTFEKPDRFATPRRLAVIVPGLPAEQPDITVERKGPRVGAPEKAIAGFLKSTGLTLADCEQRETPKGPVWFAVTQEKGRPTGELLADLLPQALAAVSWPKSMRWEETGVRWVRPIRSILCLLDSDVVTFRFGAIESGRTTLGHPFLLSGTLAIENVSSYEARLESAKVMLSPAQRAHKIFFDAWALAEGENLSLSQDPPLVEEDEGLVEWPVVRMGSIDERFMDLPPEVLRSAMRKHQRYFGVIGDDGQPAPRFVMVANTEVAAASAEITGGNERVLRARLADARFFWERDKRKKLENHLPALKDVVFHARLGSMYQKVQRIERLAPSLFMTIVDANPDWAGDTKPEQAARAGQLCKADLVTQMVGEFSDLQGIMGHYYLQAGEQTDEQRDNQVSVISLAIRDHYSPKGPVDTCPTEPVSIAVALADRLDTLAGFFAINERPTGSKDPFALRRAALGIIRLAWGNALRLPLRGALDDAFAGYGDKLPNKPGSEATCAALLAFIVERFRVLQRDLGYRHDLITAVFAVSGEDDLVRLQMRVDALFDFLNEMGGNDLRIAYRRAANILRIEEKKDGVRYEGEADPKLFTRDEERTLHERIAVANSDTECMLGLRHPNFGEAMAAMATLREPVDAFFDNVTVNCEDPALRRNRLLMLSQIRSTLDRVADFSKIEG